MSTLDCKSRIRIYDSNFYQKIHRKKQKTKIVCNFFQIFAIFFFGFLRVFACRETLQKISKLFFWSKTMFLRRICTSKAHSLTFCLEVRPKSHKPNRTSFCVENKNRRRKAKTHPSTRFLSTSSSLNNSFCLFVLERF